MKGSLLALVAAEQLQAHATATDTDNCCQPGSERCNLLRLNLQLMLPALLGVLQVYNAIFMCKGCRTPSL